VPFLLTESTLRSRARRTASSVQQNRYLYFILPPGFTPGWRFASLRESTAQHWLWGQHAGVTVRTSIYVALSSIRKRRGRSVSVRNSCAATRLPTARPGSSCSLATSFCSRRCVSYPGLIAPLLPYTLLVLRCLFVRLKPYPTKRARAGGAAAPGCADCPCRGIWSGKDNFDAARVQQSPWFLGLRAHYTYSTSSNSGAWPWRGSLLLFRSVIHWARHTQAALTIEYSTPFCYWRYLRYRNKKTKPYIGCKGASIQTATPFILPDL